MRITSLFLAGLLLPSASGAVELRADRSQPWIYHSTIEHRTRSHQESMAKLRTLTSDQNVLGEGSKQMPLMFVAAVTDSTVGLKFFAKLDAGEGDIALPSDGVEFTLRHPDDEGVVVNQKSLWVMIPRDRSSHEFWDSRTTKLSLNSSRDPDYMKRFGVIRLVAAVPNRYVGWEVINARMAIHEEAPIAAPRRSRDFLPPAGLSR